MKRRILSAICVIGLAAWANATVVTFVPPDTSSRDSNLHDMEDLGHDYYYTWGIDWSLPSGNTIQEAVLTDLGLLDDLAQFLADGNFGIGFDPDCHFYNNGVTFQITVPDGGMTMMLLGSALIGLEGLRRKLRQ